MQSGRFDIHLDHRGLEPSVNRLVLGMLASAVVRRLGAAVEPRRAAADLRGVDVGAARRGLSIALGLRLWRAINKSGHLDRQN